MQLHHFSLLILPFSHPPGSSLSFSRVTCFSVRNQQMRNSHIFYRSIQATHRMPERKVWTAQEDRVLKFLFQQRKLVKWSQISRVMETEFHIFGRNGKQCRERYHNHLDKNITNDEWSLEEENLLFDMQDQIGNKWALISSKLPGRTDNCVKNHFYSKLRKSLRNINKKIHKFMKKEYKEIKTNALYKIIETMENKNKLSMQGMENATYELCRNIKNELRDYENELVNFEDANEELKHVRGIVEDIAMFDKEIKKNPKKTSLKTSLKLEEDSYVKPASCVVSSTKSIYDDESQSYSNSELFSSSSFDHRSIQSSQHLLKPNKIFRSQSIQSQSEDDDSEEGKGVVLYKSANSITRSSQAKPTLQTQKVAALIKTEVLKRDKSFTSQHSNQSQHSQKSDQSDSNRMYMFGEESLEMRVLSPRQLTIQEKMEIHENSNDLLFCGDMDIQEDGLIHSFEQMDIGLPTGPKLPSIPKLGKERFDFS